MKWAGYLALSFLTPVLYAAQGYETIATPLGGLNTNERSWRISSKYSPYMRNVFIDQSAIEGINGYTILGTSNVLQGITGIFPFNRESGQTTFLVTDSSITLETSDFKSWTFVSSNSNAGSTLNWLQVRNKMWGYNGIDFVKTWDGSVQQILDGTKSTPNVPKFKYGAYWQERVWGFNNPAGVSNLDFSSVVTTDAIIILPDDSRAWPTTNNLKIGQGDGQIGTALWIRNGQLRAGKERSKYTIYGTNVTNYIAREDISNSVGVISNDSVVNLDNFTYYLSQNGIYRDEQRISDLIEPDLEPVSKGVQKTLENLWESQPDFLKGQFLAGATNQFFNSTATPSGFLTTFSGDRTFCTKREPNPLTAELSRLTSAVTFYNMTVFTTTETLDFNAIYNLKNWKIVSTPSGDTSLAPKLNYIIRNLTTGKETSFIWDANVEVGTEITENFLSPSGASEMINSTNTFTGNDLTLSSIAVKVVLTNWSTTTVTFTDVSQSNIRASTLKVVAQSTGQFISDISTLTSVTAWGTFDSIRNTNGGNINYYFRTSTSLVNITTQTWIGINPGSIIPSPTINNFIQWATTMAAISTTTLPNIDNVTIDHIEGAGSFNRAFAMAWKNRYWLATSTDGGNYFSLFYVKSKITNEAPDAWMPIEGINVRSFSQNNDIFYAGASTWGAVYRLDYGTNFNGSPITFVYDTPDMVLGHNYKSKDIQNYLLDADKDMSLAMSIKSSIDQGAFSSKSIPLSGSGRGIYIIKGVTNPVKTLRVRLTHSMLDKLFKVNDFSVMFNPTEIIEPK